MSTYNRVVAADENASLAPTVRARLATEMADGTSEVGAYLSDTFAPRLANTVILFGTSLEAQNGNPINDVDPAVMPSGRGWFNWCDAYLGNSLSLIRNAGVGGNRTADMLARLSADVLAYDSDWVFIGAPTNDTSAGTLASVTVANLTAIYDAIEATGRRVFQLNLPPNGGTTTTGELEAHFTVSDWIRRLPIARPSVIVADPWRALAQAGSMSPATGMAIDTIHWTSGGAEKVGRAAAEAMSSFIPRVPSYTSHSLDAATVIANPNFDTSGSGWSILGGGVSGAFSADTDSVFNKCVLTFSGVTSTGQLGAEYVENISGGRFAAGDVVQLSARIRWTGVTTLGVVCLPRPMLRLALRNVDSSYATQTDWLTVAGTEQRIPVGFPASGDAVIATSRFTVGADVDRMHVRAGFSGISDGTVTVTELSARKIT